jgi:uncharacterized membrane protein (DUF4010 family)
LGGIVSSTSVTLRFARESQSDRASGLALAGGTVGACTVMLARVAVSCAVLNPSLALAMPRFIWPGFAIGLAVLAGVWRRNVEAQDAEVTQESPLQLRTALKMTGLFQVVLFVILAVRATWSTRAVVGTAALVGLTDLDALTLSLARSATSEAMVPEAATALAVGIISNTALKLLIALIVGRGAFRAVTTLALGAMAIATAVALMVG